MDIDLVRIDGGTDVTAALIAGDIAFADSAPTAPLFNALSRGVALKALLSTGVARPGDRSNGIVVRQDLIDSGRYRGPALVSMAIRFWLWHTLRANGRI